MRNLLNPKWLFIINTLPIVVLFVLFFGQFNIIKTLLDETNIRLWKSFGLTLGILGALNFSYALYLTTKKLSVSVWYGLVALVLYITYIYVYGHYMGDIIPFSIPQWMLSGNIFLYVGTFLMPTLAYSIFVLVVHFTPEAGEQKSQKSFLIAIAIPIVGYLFVQIILPLWKPLDLDFNFHVILIFVLVATLVFLFFLVRGIFILATKKAAAWQKYQLAWKIPITIVLPLIGLLVNNGHLFYGFASDGLGIFGDFSDVWFYILAVVNGILVCLPNLEHKIYRLFLFTGRSITFAYTLYFFLVFLPFLPLSLVAIIGVGTGFLMLTPLLLFVLHTHELSKDFAYLKTLVSTKLIVVISVLGFWVIPVCITTTYLKDKSVLNETLAYLYSPDYSKKYDIDKTCLQKTLDVVIGHKEDNVGGIFGTQIPYLSWYFNWLVLDNLTLSYSKINQIEKVFFGNSSIKIRPDEIRDDSVNITNVFTKSTYDKSQKAWKSWVDLEITNKSEDEGFSEYATTIDLPEGCWISDYYLYVGDKKEFGILAEKKSAMWVFSNIRNENRDPGILYYLTGNKVAFRVFPFSKGEVRRTGIELLHKEPIQLSIDNKIVELGNAKETVNEKIETENAVYVSAQQKQTLKTVQRKPYFHFVVDVSKDKSKYTRNYTKRIQKALESNKPLAEDAQISFVNTYVNTVPLTKDWKQKFESQTFEGGFYLERAINTTLFNANKDYTYPVIVVVTDSLEEAVLDKDFSDFKFAFPESDYFFELDKTGNLKPHSLTDNPKVEREVKFKYDNTVLEYKLSDSSIAYLPNNNKPSIVLKKDIFETSEVEIKEKNWLSALTMQAQWTSQILHPETADKEWLALLRNSFVSKVMTPVTSYLVVENEAQKAMLKKKQEQVLSGNRSLDLGEDTQRMSEPGFWILAILFGLVVWYKQTRKRIL